MLKGTRLLAGEDVKQYNTILKNLRARLMAFDPGFTEVIVPLLAEQSVFTDKAGPDILDKMYTFKDKGDRDICLIPEVTALIQNVYNEHWAKELAKPVKVFYISRCYRYDRPQAGRYREFTQFGVEVLGGDIDANYEHVKKLAQYLVSGGVYKPLVSRGLSYYIEDGFEIEFESLGAQKQVVGGGKYKEGSGFAMGIDRIMLL